MFHGISKSMPALKKEKKKHVAGTIIHQYHYSQAPSCKLKRLLVGSLSHKFKTRFDHYINFTAEGWANLLVILFCSQELIKASGEHGESG